MNVLLVVVIMSLTRRIARTWTAHTFVSVIKAMLITITHVLVSHLVLLSYLLLFISLHVDCLKSV